MQAARRCPKHRSRLGLGSVAGYLLAGVAIGPFGLKLVDNVEDVRHFAELGVVFLLFVIGLELEPKRLWHMRARLVFMLMARVLLGCWGGGAGVLTTHASVEEFGIHGALANELMLLGERRGAVLERQLRLWRIEPRERLGEQLIGDRAHGLV